MKNLTRKRLHKLIFTSKPECEITQCLVCMETLSPTIPKGILPCSHSSFCFDCITDWSLITNKCPLCKSHFNEIRNSTSNEIFKVPDANQLIQDTDEFFNEETRCKVCGSDQDDANMLLCDNCDQGFHTSCLHMQGIPDIEKWYCDDCMFVLSLKKRKEVIDSMKKVGRTFEEIVEGEGRCRKRLRKMNERFFQPRLK